MILCLVALAVASCSSNNGRFRLEGSFKNLNQGEFYIYDIEHGTKDTIAVSDGRFTYDIALKDTVTLSLLFPNFSELPIFARPGAKVKMKGDVSHLRETNISGTDDNDLMTEFRLKTTDMVPPDVAKEARRFIGSHPASQVSLYLLMRHFVLCFEPDYNTAYELCEKIQKAQPSNRRIKQLLTQLSHLKEHVTDAPLPQFTAIDTDGKTVDNSKLNKTVNVVYVWASWSIDSQSMLRTLHKLQKSHHDSLAVVSICLDAGPGEGEKVLQSDSITWPNICDSLMWQSPLVTQLGIATIPESIVTDSTGTIVARSLASSELKSRIEQMLK